MGFRNPVTSVAAVDTGDGGVAGVRLYQDRSHPVPRGVAEWRTGYMDANPTIALTAAASGGSVYEINGGTYQGIAAPVVDQNVEGLPGGGYHSVYRVSSADVYQLGSMVIGAGGWLPLPLNAGWGAGSATFYQLINGICWLDFAMLAPTGVSAGYAVGTLPPGYRPTKDLYVDATYFGNIFVPCKIAAATGVITVGQAATGNTGLLGTDAFPIT